MEGYLLNSIKDYLINARIFRNSLEYSKVIPGYFHSIGSGAEPCRSFDGVHTYVMFIGIGRSGTTLIGSLLDAHPRMIIANQETALKYMHPLFFSRCQVYRLLLRNSREMAANSRIGGGGYSYAVEGQWQGRFQQLEVMGDKSKSAQDVTWLTTRPSILERMVKVTGARIRMMHVIRNPYDTIATRSVRRNLSLEWISREYFALADKLQKLIERIEGETEFDVDRIPLHLEDFISDPEKHLASVCSRLGVEAEADYLRDCAAIVKRKPHKRRHEVEWDPALIDEIKGLIAGHPFLKRYSFDD